MSYLVLLFFSVPLCREKVEAQIEKESCSQQFRAVGHNHSHDSAIDSDLQEWETEMLDIDLVRQSNCFFIIIFIVIIPLTCLFLH